MFVAYRGLPVIVFAPLCAMLAVALSGSALLPRYTETFMTGLADYIRAFFPIFLLVAAKTQGISIESLHRIAAMASGGLDTLPHNGAVITLLAITGLTHRKAYPDIFAITILKTLTVFALAVGASAVSH